MLAGSQQDIKTARGCYESKRRATISKNTFDISLCCWWNSTGLFACFPIIHLVIGLGMLFSALTQPAQSGPPLFIGLVFTLFAGSFILVGWAFAICIILTGTCITKRKNYMFCLVMAGVECMFTPFGTVLGVFSIILLIRPSVKETFLASTTV